MLLQRASPRDAVSLSAATGDREVASEIIMPGLKICDHHAEDFLAWLKDPSLPRFVLQCLASVCTTLHGTVYFQKSSNKLLDVFFVFAGLAKLVM